MRTPGRHSRLGTAATLPGAASGGKPPRAQTTGRAAPAVSWWLDRSRIVDLLQKVERALVDIKINGALPVQEAAAAAGVIVSLSFWERVRSRPWARDFVESSADRRLPRG